MRGCSKDDEISKNEENRSMKETIKEEKRPDERVRMEKDNTK